MVLINSQYPFMPLLNIQNPEPIKTFNLFVLGFRPFFLAAGIFSVVSMLIWSLVYANILVIPMQGVSNYHWHAHEMIYGFAMAVVAGFLLTAIKNWTGIQTLQHTPLIFLALLWLSARICLLLGYEWIELAAGFDILFNLGLFIALFHPIFKVKQWKQIGIISKIFLLVIFNGLFYLGAFGILDSGIYWSINGGFFLLIALVLTMGRRVMPSFIEQGVGYPVKLKNSRLLDISSLLLFLLLAISETFMMDPLISSYSASILFVISLLRLLNWYTSGIWNNPLLWGLYLAFIFFTLGFLIFALLPYSSLITRSIALHAFAIGGLGLITISMMSRVTLGHTGRDINQPSSMIAVAQWLLVLAAMMRVIAPIAFPSWYLGWIGTSQLLWIIAFLLFIRVNFSLLIKPRIDGAGG
jgi:uncharacterized protein involved in response to NO